MRYKAFPAEFKADVDKRTFVGYASTFGNVDSGRDRVLPGAFAKTIKERAGRVKVLWQHNPSDPIGKPIRMEEDTRGLLTESKVSATTLGRDVLVLMEDGVIDQLSIGYDVIKDGWDREEDVRDLVELKLWEFSPVTFAMNEMAYITDLKNATLDDIDIITRRLAILADNGLKSGRVLSKRNLGLVKQAYEALGSLLAAVETDDEEPGDEPTPKSDDQAGADLEEPAEPVKATPKQASAENPFGDLIKQVGSLGSWAEQEMLTRELRAFGQSLRNGERN